jgi:hypothetical protein
MTNELFEVDKIRITNTNTCRHCVHRQRWQCGGSIIQYCGKQKSNRTDNGLKKIKVTDKACILFETEASQIYTYL